MRATIAVLVSGGGTTVESFIRAGLNDESVPLVGLIICNNPKAGVFERIENLNSETGLNSEVKLINSKTHPASDGEEAKTGLQTKAEEAAIISALQAGNFDIVVSMGYMKKIGLGLVHEFGWRSEYTSPHQARMLNSHPGLLPATKGLYGIYVQRYVLDNHLPAGQTLHVVAEHYDEGPTIAEHQVGVEPDDTAESLFERVKAAEKRFLLGDVPNFISKRQEYLGGRNG